MPDAGYDFDAHDPLAPWPMAYPGLEFVLNSFTPVADLLRDPQLVDAIYHALFGPALDAAGPGLLTGFVHLAGEGPRGADRDLMLDLSRESFDEIPRWASTVKRAGLLISTDCVQQSPTAKLTLDIIPVSYEERSTTVVCATVGLELVAPGCELAVIQAGIVHLVLDLARRMPAVTAAVGPHGQIGLSQLEAGSGWEQSQATTDRWIRGPYWGIVLGPLQIETLGGMERIEAEAPFARIQRVGTPEHPLLYLQATETVRLDWTPTPSLVAYLAPVLRPLPPFLVQLLRRRASDQQPISVAPRVEPRPEPEPIPSDPASMPVGAGFHATLKWEMTRRRKTFGPLIVMEKATRRVVWESADWVGEDEARAIVEQQGWTFNIDG